MMVERKSLLKTEIYLCKPPKTWSQEGETTKRNAGADWCMLLTNNIGKMRLLSWKAPSLPCPHFKGTQRGPQARSYRTGKIRFFSILFSKNKLFAV